MSAAGPPLRAPSAYASFGRRALARLIDVAIFVAVVLIVRAAGLRDGDCSFIFACRAGEDGAAWTVADYATGFAYNWAMIALNDGRTLGKVLMGIRIARADRSRLGPWGAAKREAVAYLSALALGIGFLWALWDEERRTWHDEAAHSRAFRARP